MANISHSSGNLSKWKVNYECTDLINVIESIRIVVGSDDGRGQSVPVMPYVAVIIGELL